ncbi:MAG: nucleotidyltransferase family protein [Burkholderiales bacterium]
MTSVQATAMVLAAGRGERMRPLTDHTPKPLLKIGGHSLIEHHLTRLAQAGFKRVVINHAHLGSQIVSAIGDGSRWGLTVVYSAEAQALETAGGIANALWLIDSDAFAVINSDVFSEFDYARLGIAAQQLQQSRQSNAHLVLVDNPPHNPDGDFALVNELVAIDSDPKLTFAGLAAYRAEMFSSLSVGEKMPLAPLLRTQIQAGRVSGEHFSGYWTDVGTPQRLAAANERLKDKRP